MMVSRRYRLPALYIVLGCLLASLILQQAGAMVMPVEPEPQFAELILDDHSDMGSRAISSARLAESSSLDESSSPSPDVLAAYAQQVNAYYIGKGTTLTSYLGARYPGLLAGQQIYLLDEGADLNNPVIMLTFLIEDRLDTYNNWQQTDSALRDAGLTMDAWVSKYYLSIYGQLRDELNGTRMVDVKDYDGDWKADFAVWRASTGEWHIRNSASGTTSIKQLGSQAQGDKPAPGDFDGDRKLDYAVWRPSTGVWTIIRSSDGATITEQWGSQPHGDLPVPNDYDGDGKTDIAVWRASTGQWFHIRSSDGQRIGPPFGDQSKGDRPVLGDFDGDGKADFAVWRASTGEWHIRNSASGTISIKQLGSQAQGDRPVPGDFDGDKLTDLAVWRPSSGVWTLILSSSGVTLSQQWGTQGDIPVQADYDGDGKVDYAVWRPSTAQWFHIRSLDGRRIGPPFGNQSAGDIPLASVFNR